MTKKILNVLFVIYGLWFLNSGLNKFLNYMPSPKISPADLAAFSHFLEIKWLMPLVAIVEIIGGLLFALPKTRTVGAIMLFPILVGIVLTHNAIMTEGLGMSVLFFAINVLALVVDGKKLWGLLK